MKKALLIFVSALAGCATTSYQVSELTPDELKSRLQNGAISVRPVTAPVRLTERTKGQAVGNFIVSSVVSSVAASGTGARTASEMQANAQISQSFGQQLNQSLPTGSEVESGGGADARLARRLDDRFRQALQTEKTSPIELAVSTSRWELGYESFFTSSDYTLSYALTVAVIDRDTDKPRTLKRIQCQGDVPGKMPLDAWQADNYAAVNKAADDIADNCFKRTITAFGLE